MAESPKTGSFRWGICATGKICQDFTTCLHYLKHKTDTSLDIVAVAARSKDSADQFAARFGISAAYGTYAELFADPAVDIVYIGAIHPMHKELVLGALNAKKHVVCEKPLGMNSQEVAQMQECAKANNRFLLEAMWTRFLPLIKRAKKMILEDQVIGEVKALHTDFGVPFGRDVARIWDLKTGGGALLDLGVYPVAALTWIFGTEQPESYKVEGRLDPEGTGVDVLGTFSATYSGTRQAVVSWSGVAQTPEEVTVTGTKGFLRVHGPAHCTEKISLHTQCGRIFEESVIEEKMPVFGSEYVLNFPNSEALIYEIKATMEAISVGKLEADEYTWADTARVTDIMDKCRKEIGLVYPQDH